MSRGFKHLMISGVALLGPLNAWAGTANDNSAGLDIMLPASVAVLIITGLVLILRRFAAGLRKNTLASQTGSTRKLNLLMLSAGSLIALVILLAGFALSRVEKRIKANVATALETVLQTTLEALNFWAENSQFHLAQLAGDPQLIALVQRQLEVPPKRADLLKSPALTELRNFFRYKQDRFGQADFFIIARDFTSIASMHDDTIGSKNPIANQALDLLNRAFQGETVMVPPIWSDAAPTASADTDLARLPTMFFASPIKNPAGRCIAVVAQHIDPSKDFTRLIQLGRIGKNGETYAFGKYGNLLSESRFDAELRRIGLIRNGQKGILNISLRDPGGNMLEGYRPAVPRYQQPLTAMAEQATRRKSGVNIEGYRDYRGVVVFGAWLWDRKLGIGMATEIDRADALSTYYTARNVIITVLGITVLLALGSLAFAVLIDERANRALRKSHEELEHRVQQRTAELAVSEERFALAVRGVGAGIWDLNPETGKGWSSERFKKLLGYDGTDIDDSFSSWVNMIHPDDRQAVTTALQTHLDRRTPFNEICRFRCRSGEYRWFRTTGQARWDDNGKACRVAGSIVDITEGKRAQEEVKKLSRATENSPASVVITDKRGQIEYVNPTFSRVTGYTPEEALGKNPRVLKSGNLPRLFYKNLWDTILAGNVWEGDFINRKKSGEEFWESASISPIKNDQGEITHFVAVKQDVTERKKMEAELVQAKQAADEANQAKSDFLANMSHEIRTPMNAVLGMTHLALKTGLTAKQRDYLNKIQSSANSLLGIINDILDFSKIEAGKLDIEAVDFNLDGVLENLANLIMVKAQEKEDLEVLFAPAADVPRFLVGDPLRLGQILINLTNNAVKFTKSGEIVVAIEKVAVEADRVTLSFSVSDTGIGLTEDQMSRLFQSFSQADTSTTRKYGGTGLGLAISKKLVNLMGGEIHVESQYGRGTTFFFTAVFGLSKEKAQRRFTPLPDLRGIKALVVDDNATSREIFKDLLGSFSFEVLLAASGEEAITEIENASQEKPFDLVIMDWKMPGMDGIEAANRIKNLPGQKKIPAIILVTAYGREEIIQKFEKADLDGFLLKPVNASVLFDAIMQAFGKDLPATSRIAQRRKETDAFRQIRGARILLVEDNEINQQVAKEILEGAGLNVTLASNGLEAVEAVKESNYDAVLMDVQMPVMDGYIATRQIRNLKSVVRNIPIIAMTAHAMAGDDTKSLEAGMNGHVTKPIDPDQLFSALQKWIRPAAKRTPARHPDASDKNAAIPGKTPDMETLPDALPGFNLAEGLERLMGNQRLYRKLLADFGTKYLNVADEIRNALNSNDMNQVHGLVHNIKGLAGNLAASELQAAAAKMEELIKGKPDTTADEADLNRRFAKLENALNQALQAVQIFKTPNSEKSVEPPEGPTAEVFAELPQAEADRIRQAVEMGDVFEINSIAEKLRSESDALAPFCDKILQLAEDFDFEGILDLINQRQV